MRMSKEEWPTTHFISLNSVILNSIHNSLESSKIIYMLLERRMATDRAINDLQNMQFKKSTDLSIFQGVSTE